MSEQPTTETPSDATTNGDAFSPDNIGVVHFIVQARILDTLYAILAHHNPDGHRDLLEAHAQGLLLGPSPLFAGQFLTDEMNPTP